MPTRNVNLTAELPLQQDIIKRERLGAKLKAGLDALDRGAFHEVADADLDDSLDDLAAAQ
jgi:hypothetical protein